MRIKVMVKITDGKTGEVIQEFESKSWVIQFLQILSGLTQYYTSGATLTGYQVRDTGNTLRTYAINNANTNQLRVNSGATIITYGIVVGGDATANDPTQYHLGAIRANGAGANQLGYSVHTFGEPGTVGTVVSFTIARTVTNTSGNPVDVNEIGIYTQNNFGATAYFMMIIRDKLPVTDTIPNLGTRTITYTISFDNAG